MKTVLGILAGIGILALLAVLWLQTDDELNPQAKALLERVAIEGESRAYRYLMGIFADEGEDPGKVGARLVADIRNAQERDAPLSIEGLDYLHYPEHRKLALPEGPRFCRWADAGCVEQVFAAPATLQQTLETHAVLLQRYQQFLTFDDYATLTIPAADEPFPPFRYLQTGGRLLLLKAISLSQQGKREQAMGLLSGHINDVRRQLEQQDMLVGKVLFVSLLSETLDVASVLSREAGCITSEVAALSASERSLDKALARDLWGFHATFQNLDGDGSFFHVGAETPEWWVRLLFKPVMTTNGLWPWYQYTLAQSSMSASEFADSLSQESPPSLETSLLRNYAGRALLSVSAPDYQEFIAVLHDLEAKRVLFNAFNGCQTVSPEVVQNPYYHEPNPAFRAGPEGEENIALCFSGPLADDRKIRCLRLES